MARPVPFFFCRYQISLEDESLDASGQLQLLSELQGSYHAHRQAIATEADRDTVLMRPRQRECGPYRVLTWSVGQRIAGRVTVDYDPRLDELAFRSVVDAGHRYADFIAIPELSVLAVDDRASESHLGGRQAVNRLKTIVRSVQGGDVDIMLTTSASDVEMALQTWELSEFSFVVRPFNPHPPGDLSERLSDEFKRDGIGEYRAKAKPAAGQEMRPAADGHIASVVELANAGYGQYAFKGTTDEGHEAQIKRPKFEFDRAKNERRQSEPRELRVLIDSEDRGDDTLFDRAASALVSFYGPK